MHHTTTPANGHGHPCIEPFDQYCQGVLDLSARVFALAAEESPQLRTLLHQSAEEIEFLREALAGRSEYRPTQAAPDAATLLEPFTQLRQDFQREMAYLRDELRQGVRTLNRPSVDVEQVRLEIAQVRLMARAAQAENDRLQAALERLSTRLNSSQPETDIAFTSDLADLTTEFSIDLEIET